MNSRIRRHLLGHRSLNRAALRGAILSMAIVGVGCGSSGSKGTGTPPNGAASTATGGQAGSMGDTASAQGGQGGSGGMMASASGGSVAPGGGGSGTGSGSGGVSPVSGGSGGNAVANSSSGSGGAVAANNDSGAPATSDASAAPAMGGFPRNDMVSTDQKGPYQVMSYTDGLDNPAYASSIMYYPVDATPPFASTVFSCGFTATKEGYQNFLGPLFASHGIAILLESPTTTADLPPTRAMQLEAGVQQISTENMRDGSPLKGKLATDRVCLIGHSMGGGGTLIAAQDEGNKIRCDSPLQPWEPGLTFPMIVAPTMFIAAQSDTVAAVASNALPFYMSIPSPVPKYYVEVAGANHFLSSGDLGTNYDTQSKYLIAFYKVYLEDDMRYMSVLTAMPDPALSQYMHSP